MKSGCHAKMMLFTIMKQKVLEHILRKATLKSIRLSAMLNVDQASYPMGRTILHMKLPDGMRSRP